MLDYFPNADHAGIYAAQASGEYERAGLDVKIQPPPDAAAPLKLLQAGRVDLAISYEPELLLARDQGADLVAVGALVQKPLTSLMSLGERRDHRPEAARRASASAPPASPYQSAYLRTILDEARRRPRRGQGDQRRLQPHAGDALRQVDATLGAFWNYEGVDLERRKRDPEILRMEDLGVPTYNELIFVARRADLGEEGASQAAPLPAGHRPRPPAARASGREAGVDALLEADDGLDRDLQAAVVRRDAAGLLPRGRRAAVRLPGPGRVGGLRALDARQRAAQAASGRSRAADQRVPAGRGARPGDVGARMSPRIAACTRCTPARPFHSP